MANDKPKYAKPLPRIDEESKGFWEGCQRRELYLQRCRACGTVRHYPRALCPNCLSDRTEWMRAQGYGQELLRREHDLVFAVRAMQLDFLKPARLDDALEVSAELSECRRASAVFSQAIRRGDELLLTAQVRVAALDAGGFRPRAIPSPLLGELKALERPVR